MVPLVFTIYVVASYLILQSQVFSNYPTATNILSLVLVLFLPLMPLLSAFGWSTGEMMQAPNGIGVIVGLVIYNFLLFTLVKCIFAIARAGRKNAISP